MAGRVVAIELGDAALALADDSGVLTVEPGYFVVADGRARFGAEAAPLIRRHAHAASTRYWRDLAAGELARPLGGFASPAAIAAAQLQVLWSRHVAGQAGACVAMPAWWGDAERAIFARQCTQLGIPLLGLAPAAAAVARGEHPGRELVHLDIGLHGLTATRVRQAGGAGAGEHDDFAALGVEPLLRLAMEWLARRFVESSRYDPLHDADAEQGLFDRLPAWLARLAGTGEAVLELQTRSGTFTAAVAAAEFQARLVAAFAPLLNRLRARVAERGPHALLASARLADFPGVLAALARLPDTVVHVLTPGAAALGLFARRAVLAGADASGVVATLPWDRPPVELADSPAATGHDNAPTHLLAGNRVYPLGERPFRIGAELGDGDAGLVLDGGLRGLSRQHCTIRREHGALTLFDHSRFGTWLNGLRVEGAVILEAGDVIGIGSPPVELRLVREAGTHGA